MKIENESLVILLVEDDPAHAEIVRRCLESSQNALHQIIHVEDGQAALDYLFGFGEYSKKGTNPRPHLILLDLRLPKVDGLEVLKQVKSDPGLGKIPVVVLTTSAAEMDVAKAYDQRANSYLVKPVDFSQFSELMNKFGLYWLAVNQYSD